MADDKHTSGFIKGSMECPYPETPFESLKETLLKGVNHMFFCHQERAIANLVAAALRDKKWEDVLVICKGKRHVRKFIEYLSQNLSHMHLDGEILVRNDEEIQMTENRSVFATSEIKNRGSSSKCVIFSETTPSPDYLSILSITGVEAFTVTMTEIEEVTVHLLSPITKNLDA